MTDYPDDNTQRKVREHTERKHKYGRLSAPGESGVSRMLREDEEQRRAHYQGVLGDPPRPPTAHYPTYPQGIDAAGLLQRMLVNIADVTQRLERVENHLNSNPSKLVIEQPDPTPLVGQHRNEAALRTAAESLRTTAAYLEKEIGSGGHPSEVLAALHHLAELFHPGDQRSRP
jgi:hypothetical protein